MNLEWPGAEGGEVRQSSFRATHDGLRRGEKGESGKRWRRRQKNFPLNIDRSSESKKKKRKASPRNIRRTAPYFVGEEFGNHRSGKKRKIPTKGFS